MTMIKHTHRKIQNGYGKTYSLLVWTKFYERQVFSHAYDTSHYHTISSCMYGGGLVAKSCPTLATPWTVVWHAPLSVGFSRQKYWSGLPFPSPGDLPDPGIEPGSPALAGGCFTIWATREAPLQLARKSSLEWCLSSQPPCHMQPSWLSKRKFGTSRANSSTVSKNPNSPDAGLANLT